MGVILAMGVFFFGMVFGAHERDASKKRRHEAADKARQELAAWDDNISPEHKAELEKIVAAEKF